jgi:hypothetical protein
MSERLADHATTAPDQNVTSLIWIVTCSAAILAESVKDSYARSRSRND